MRRIQLSYPNVTATLALVVAVGGGTAWAAATIGAKDIKPDAVRSKHIKDGQVGNVEIAENAVDGEQIAPGEIGNDHLSFQSVSSFSILDENVTSQDIGSNEVGSQEVQQNSITGDHVVEATLDGVAKGCDRFSIAASGQVENSATIPVTFTSDAQFIQASSTCGQTPEIRRTDVGVYRICMPAGETPDVLLVSPNHAGAGSSGTDNILSVDLVAESACPPASNGVAQEVRSVDVGATNEPQDGSFRFIAVNP